MALVLEDRAECLLCSGCCHVGPVCGSAGPAAPRAVWGMRGFRSTVPAVPSAAQKSLSGRCVKELWATLREQRGSLSVGQRPRQPLAVARPVPADVSVLPGAGRAAEGQPGAGEGKPLAQALILGTPGVQTDTRSRSSRVLWVPTPELALNTQGKSALRDGSPGALPSLLH